MENISAISTARGTGGIAIIRISGDDPLSLAEGMFRASSGAAVRSFEPNVMYPGHIVCDGFEDYGMCVYFKAPRSFTGEDVVEFHCHGGELVSEGVLERTFFLGARPAARGEFTKRAFLNGKMSLASAEGLIDMINAESSAQLRAGNLLYIGKSVKRVAAAQEKLKDILASIDADADYPEEDVAGHEIGDLAERLRLVLDEIETLSSTYSRGRCMRGGVSVAICGRPNVGKSSLLNALLGFDRAIVSDEAGTTRDAVEGNVEIDGILFRLTDTAGLREHAGDVESKGIGIARSVIASSDIVMYVSDGTPDGAPDAGDARLLKVFNKADIRRPPDGFDCAVSALTGYGLDGLRKALSAAVPISATDDEAVICEERHRDALERAAGALRRAVAASGDFPIDAIAIDVEEAWSALGEITGETASESIIDEIFSKFCVGK